MRRVALVVAFISSLATALSCRKPATIAADPVDAAPVTDASFDVAWCTRRPPWSRKDPKRVPVPPALRFGPEDATEKAWRSPWGTAAHLPGKMLVPEWPSECPQPTCRGDAPDCWYVVRLQNMWEVASDAVPRFVDEVRVHAMTGVVQHRDPKLPGAPWVGEPHP